MSGLVSIIGMREGLGDLSATASRALTEADLIIAAPRFHASLSTQIGKTATLIAWPRPYGDVFNVIEQAKNQTIVICATGDPMWFGAGSGIVGRLGLDRCTIIPNVSGFQMAAARMGWALNECETVTIHGRQTASILPYIYRRGRVLLLSEDRESPQKVAALLKKQGFGSAHMTVLANVGGAAESRVDGQAYNWTHDVPDFHIIAVQCPDLAPNIIGFGIDDSVFVHSGKITKREVRACALAKLAAFPGAVFWDVGAGSGAVAIEFMTLASRCRAFAIDKDPDQIAMARENAARCGVPYLQHVEAVLPDGLGDLPPPDAIFIGGGLSLSVIAQCYDALLAGGNLVAHSVTLESEAILTRGWQDYGGSLTRLAVNYAEPLGMFHGWRPLMPVTQWHISKTQNPATNSMGV